MSTTNVETTALPKRPRLPEELASSTPFLMKRLGFKLKEHSMAAYEQAGLPPYHHALLAVLDEGARETQGAIAAALRHDRRPLVGPPGAPPERQPPLPRPRPARPPPP